MNRIILIFFSLPFLLYGQQADLIFETSLETIAFGSCSKQDLPEKQLWTEINDRKPDLWVWLGDNIYGDTEDMSVMRGKYEQQKSHEGYQQLIKQTEIIGIWDDHDFGSNDAGKEYPKKRDSKEELFRFLDVPPDHPARFRPGAYQSYLYTNETVSIKVILLDARYFRDSLRWENPNTADKAAIPNPTGDVLGEEQWLWLEEQLADQSVDLFLLASGIQVLPTEHRWEKWSNFPKSRLRLLSLIDQKTSKPLILLSGDRHISEVSKTILPNYPYDLWEFTTSSLTSPITGKAFEPNQYRVKEIIYEQNFAELRITDKAQKLKCSIRYVGANGKVLQQHQMIFED